MSGAERLYDAIGGIDPEIIEEALDYTPCRQREESLSHAKRSSSHLIGLIAAVLALMVGLPGLTLMMMFGEGSGSSTFGETAGTEGSVYSHYTGPVLPLLSQENADGITAERNVDYDFSDDQTGDFGHYTLVTDDYILHNTTAEEKTLSMLYPYVSGFGCQQELTLTVDGMEPPLLQYAGGSTSQRTGTSPSSWEDYRDLLGDGTYLSAALTPQEVLADQPVTVYEITDMEGLNKPEDMEYWTPSMKISLTLSAEDTGLLTYGINGGTREDELHRVYTGDLSARGSSTKYIITMGGQITDYRVQGYSDYAASEEAELPEFRAAVNVQETTLEEILYRLVSLNIQQSNTWSEAPLPTDPEFISAYCRQILQDGLEKFALQDTGSLEEAIHQAAERERILYRAFSVTIPAGESVAVSASYRKGASYNFVSDLPDTTEGYDLVTALGSNLRFTAQTCSLTNADAIEILDQNFGFDLEKGVTRVTLDLEQPHYYLNVKKKEQNQ